MKEVKQTVSDRDKGNCMQASCASILDLELDGAPNFMSLSEESWGWVFTGFFWGFGWYYAGTGQPDKQDPTKDGAINGHILASVKSRNYKGKQHLVVMRVDGVVVNDPDPKEHFKNENIIESKELLSWYMFDKCEPLCSPK